MYQKLTCNYEEQNIPSAPTFRGYTKEMCIVHLLMFARNQAVDVYIGIVMLF